MLRTGGFLLVAITSGACISSLVDEETGDPMALDMGAVTNDNENNDNTNDPPPSTELVPLIRINAGGPTVSDPILPWEADRNFSPPGRGSVRRGIPVNGDFETLEVPSDVFLSESFCLDGYQFDVVNGTYDVRLFFAETFCFSNEPNNIEQCQVENRRPMNLSVEGVTLEEFEPFEASGILTAMRRDFVVEVTDGVLDITLENLTIECTMLNALEIRGSPEGGEIGQ